MPFVVEITPWSYRGHAVHAVQQLPQADDASLPAVLLVHGFGASTDHWRHNIPVLGQTHCVHAVDLLGFGRSAKPSDLAYGGPLWRDQLVAYVRERIGRPTVIAGNSLGGFAALAAGAALQEHCAGVRALVRMELQREPFVLPLDRRVVRVGRDAERLASRGTGAERARSCRAREQRREQPRHAEIDGGGWPLRHAAKDGCRLHWERRRSCCGDARMQRSAERRGEAKAIERVAEVEMGPPLRVLCLHGHLTSAEIFKQQRALSNSPGPV